MARRVCLRTLTTIGLLVGGLLAGASLLQARPEEEVEEATVEQESARTDKAGLEVPTIGGPNSVGREIEDQDQIPEYRFTILNDALQPWFDWKRRLSDKHGFNLGVNATVLGQYSGDATGEDDVAGGGIYRIQGGWTMVGRGTGHAGTLNFRAEYRSRIGPLGPSSLSGDLGISAVNSGFAYGDEFGPDLAVFNWTQMFADQRAGFAIGRLDFAAYLDPYPYQTFAKAFLNRAFILNTTTATPGVGALGAGIKGFVSDQIWLGGMAYDANAVSGEWDLDTFDSGELFKHVEIGWTPGFDKRKTHKVQLTYWQMDERVETGKPEGSGWLLTMHGKFGDKYQPFLRAGSSDGGGGAPAEDAVSIGVGISNRYDELAIGLGWSKPSEETLGPDLDDEYAFEVSYRIQMSPNSTIMPDIQMILDPANNPTADSIWIWSLRVRWDI